jgi:predicted NUDIX family NTP pyrophosphohydrolase
MRAKRIVGQRVNVGFEKHWEEITGKFRKISDTEKLSWKQLETAAIQVRKRGMPPLYRN